MSDIATPTSEDPEAEPAPPEWDARWDDDPDAEADFSDTQTRETAVAATQGEDIKLLRERAKQFDQAQAALPALQRENAWLKSGLDLESPVGQLFVKGYSGEFTADAIKAEAAKYGVPQKYRVPQEG